MIKINGIEYKVEAVKEFTHNGDKRQALTLRRPKGTRLYFAIVYGNGAVSGVV